jgi:hypothetical protein
MLGKGFCQQRFNVLMSLHLSLSVCLSFILNGCLVPKRGGRCVDVWIDVGGCANMVQILCKCKNDYVLYTRINM